MSADEHWNRDDSGKFPSAPIALRLYVIFSVIVYVSGLAAKYLLPTPMWRSITAVIGNNPYQFYFLGVFSALWLFSNRHSRSIAWWGLIVILALQVLGGIMGFLVVPSSFHGPDLVPSSLRLVWTLVVPLFWLVVLLSPSVIRYCKKNPPSDSQGGMADA